MSNRLVCEFIEESPTTVVQRTESDLSDRHLLGRYLDHRDESALAALVRRHAALVWGVCRRVLGDHHDAEDAFQAVFLVLIRRAGSISKPELLANWLYGVACQTALKARSTRAKRRTREALMFEMPEPKAPERRPWEELSQRLDGEISRLPDKFRTAIVLCELEGWTRAEAARRLGVPEGTLASWCARGRRMLARRLGRRSKAVSAATLTLLLAQEGAAGETVPATLVSATIGAATRVGASGAVDAPAYVLSLADSTTQTSSTALFKISTALVLGLGVFVGARLAPQARGEHATKSDHQRVVPASQRSDQRPLQGVWLVVASELDGVKEFDQPKRNHDRLEFHGDRVTYWTSKGPQRGVFRIAAAASPQEIDIEFENGAKLKGLYELADGRLRFCWTKGGRRPAGFDTSVGELLTFLYTYEKSR